MLANAWYKRRMPWTCRVAVATASVQALQKPRVMIPERRTHKGYVFSRWIPTNPILGPPPRAVYIKGETRRHGGLVRFVASVTTPKQVKVHRPLVVRQDVRWRPGLVMSVAALRGVAPVPPPSTGVGSQVYLGAGLGSYTLQANLPSIVLQASLNVTFSTYAHSSLSFELKANTNTAFSLGADMSVTSHINFFRGEDVVINFTMTPVQDITGWTLTFKVADQLAGTIKITKTAAIVNGPAGQFSVSIANADTSSLAVGRYVWDVRRVDSGYKSTVADGYITLKQEVTP
jgi:hypothetical protein